MYNLIVSADCIAWTSSKGHVPHSRFGEHTAEGLKARYRNLDESAIGEISRFPTIFAYEEPCDSPARLGRITKIVQFAGPDLKFEYTFDDDIPPIPPKTFSDFAFELDITAWEMNRTHWFPPICHLHGHI